MTRYRFALLAAAAVLFAGAATTYAGSGAPAFPVVETDAPLACTYNRLRELVTADRIGELVVAPPRDTATGRRSGARIAGRVAEAMPPRVLVRVQSPAELEDTLRSGFVGVVLVPRGASWDMSGRTEIPVRSGLSLIGERGNLCSRPTLYTNTKSSEHSVFKILGNDVQVEGIHFRGPAAGNRTPGAYVNAILVVVDRMNRLGQRILIRDNEFDEWTGSGVGVSAAAPMNVRSTAEYDTSWPRPTRADAELVRIEGNYLHHNAMDGGGHGVTVEGGVYATVWGNVFNYNRHAVASDGYAYGGYIARFNYVLQGGFMQGNFWNQHFDVHGTELDENGQNTGYGGTSGEYFEIAFNTIRGEQSYYVLKTRPAFMLRGTPTKGARFDANIVVHDDLDAAVSLKGGKNDIGIGEDHDKFKFGAAGNRFDTDYSGELATGDFDGDRRTDVFVATGTAWYVSRAGVEPWQFLHASDKRVAQLGFADMDNDGITDVVWRAPNGQLGYLKSGAGAVVPITTSSAPISELRFGDFDGDAKTDIFRRETNGQWLIWYGRTRTWTPAQSSSFPLAALRFGEFDAKRGTDVVAVLRDQWAVSSGAAAPWIRLNDRLRGSFAGVVVADFDGDSRSDLAFDDGRQTWTFSSGGSGPLRTLRVGDGQTPMKPLGLLLLGHFDGDRSAEVVSFWTDSLVIWRGGMRGHFARHSRAPMR